uniref:Mitochondrial import receptor subunit TOM7 homolog n=1 Tax=Caenorhabditis japonica TaxID=281687 RepID=A0A8R1IAJ1_CAEJA
MKLSPTTKSLIGKTVDIGTFAVQWGFVPFVVYLGFKKGAEPMPNGQLFFVSFIFRLFLFCRTFNIRAKNALNTAFYTRLGFSKHQRRRKFSLRTILSHPIKLTPNPNVTFLEDKVKIDDINVDTKKITVTTDLPASEVLEALKKTGKEIKQLQ